MTHTTCRLTANNRNQLRNPTLGNRVLYEVPLPFLRSYSARTLHRESARDFDYITTLAVANLKTGYPRQCMRKVASGNVRVSKLLRAYTIDLLTRAHST